MIFPESIKIVSLPFLLMGSLLLFCGIFFTGFAHHLPRGRIGQRGHLLFGLTTLSASLYAFSGAMVTSSVQESGILFWSNVLFSTAVPLVVFFNQFSAFHLGMNRLYFHWVFPLITFLFLPLFLFPGLMIQPVVQFQTVKIFGIQYLQPFAGLGVFGIIFAGWAFVNSAWIGIRWLIYFRGHREELGLMLGFYIFVVAALFDIGVALHWYVAPNIFIFGFGGLLFAMSLQLFQNTIRVNQEAVKRNQELKKVNEEMRFLVGTISHDVMGPLVSIHGFTDLLQEMKNPTHEERVKYLGRIQTNADHMKALLNDLASYVRIGRVEEKLETVNLKNTVHQALAMLDIPNRFPEAKVIIAGRFGTVLGSYKSLKQVLMNLVENSLKYAERPDVVIQISGRVQNEGSFLAVEDNGPGIPKGFEEKVFETFYRFSTEPPGTGMGLSIVKKIIENYGGKVWVDSDYREGARFCAFLPKQAQGPLNAV